MPTNKFFLQLKNFILSNKEVLDTLNANFIQEDWKEDIFYAFSFDYILKWEEYIGYNEICKELQNRGNKKLISDDDEEWCCSIIRNNMNKEKELELNQSIRENKDIYTTFFLTTNSISEDNKEHICPNKSFYLISRKVWELINLDESNEYYGKISIKTGKNKILIKCSNNQIILLKLMNNKDVNIEPKNLQKYLIQYIINFDDLQDENEINKLINEINKMDLIDLEQKIRDNFLIINDKKLKIQLKEALNISFNIDDSSINKISTSLNEEEIKNLEKVRSILKVNYICQTFVPKIKFCTYIIASMYSLSQIPEFTDYFFCNKNNQLFNSLLLSEFKNYIDNLWKSDDENTFNPENFLLLLKKNNKNIFDNKSEKQPIVFLDKMLDYINEELNNKDIKITSILKETNEEFLDKYNSIVGKVFYGIFKQKNICNTCGKPNNNSIENEMFKYINIDINKYSDAESNLDNSLSFFYLDDLIDFYFTNQMNLSFCENCKEKKEFKICKEIYKYPDILIINIDWGQFSEEEGFGLEENNLIFDKIIDMTKYAYIKKNEIKYEIRSIISYPANKKRSRKYITLNKHLVDNKFYIYQPGGYFCKKELKQINDRSLIPSVLFYEKKK